MSDLSISSAEGSANEETISRAFQWAVDDEGEDAVTRDRGRGGSESEGEAGRPIGTGRVGGGGGSATEDFFFFCG